MKKIVKHTGCVIWAALLVVIPILAAVAICEHWSVFLICLFCFLVLIDLFAISALIVVTCGVDEDR